MATLETQLDEWRAGSQRAKQGLLRIRDVDAANLRIRALLDGHEVIIVCPADDDSLFELETSAPSLAEWHSILASFSFEQEGLTLPVLLDKMAAVYQRLHPQRAAAAAAAGESASATAAAPAAAAAASSSPAQPAQQQPQQPMTPLSSHPMDESSTGGGVGSGARGGGSDDEDWGDGDGEGGEDGDGWGDFKEANESEELHDDEWTAQKQLKKRLLARAESLRVEQAHATATQKQANAAKGIKSIFSSDAAATMLVNDCMSFMRNSTGGTRVTSVDDNVFQWNVKLSQFDAGSAMQRGLDQLRRDWGIDYVELEIRFMMDLYPFFPPTVRLIRPRMKNFMIGRLVSMREIQLSQWNPTRTVHDILSCIRRVLTLHGEVDFSEPDVNDPNSSKPPYTALEFDLLRLTMLTDILPRAVNTMGDPEAIRLIVPKSKPKAEQTAAAAAVAAAAAGPVQSAPLPLYSNPFNSGAGGATGGFKKGTGYGGGYREAGWDVEAWRAAQLKQESEVCEIAHSLSVEMGRATVSASLAGVLEQSCLIPFLQKYLSNDSISDIEAHSIIYHDILDIVSNMSKHQTLLPLFELLPGEKKSLASHLADMRAQAAIAAKFDKFATGARDDPSSLSVSGASASSAAAATAYDSLHAHISKKSKVQAAPAIVDTHPKSITAHILEVSETVDTALALRRSVNEQERPQRMDIDEGGSATAAAASPAAAAAAAASSSGPASSVPPVDYVAIQSPHRFGEVEKFSSHHYLRQQGASSSAAPSRLWVKRLATEYSDLSKSLPIDTLSSVYLRYLEDQMAFAQFLIAAPDETPYGFGMFLTTGGGSVRFNPNLYNCGKVCLSLLGTWAGASGETWSASTSTFLQVCVSIQSLILVPEPYFNEPGYQSSMGTPSGKIQSDNYNRVIQAIDMMKKPPEWATEIVRNHFCLHRANILHQCRGWAKTNKEVERLLPQLEAQLEKQTLADGSRPVLPVARSVEAGAEAADAAAAAAPRRHTRSSSAAAAAAATVDDADADKQLDAPEEAAADDEELEAEAADQGDF